MALSSRQTSILLTFQFRLYCTTTTGVIDLIHEHLHL